MPTNKTEVLIALRLLFNQYERAIINAGNFNWIAKSSEAAKAFQDWRAAVTSIEKGLYRARKQLLQTGFDVPNSWLEVEVVGKLSSRSLGPACPGETQITHSSIDVGALRKIQREIKAEGLKVVAEREAEMDGGLFSDSTEKSQTEQTRHAEGKAQSASPGGKTQSSSRCPPGQASEWILNCLCDHHGYDVEGIDNWEPLKGREIVECLDSRVSAGSVSAWFKKHFDGHAMYEAACHRQENSPLPSKLRELREEETSVFIDPNRWLEDTANPPDD